MSIRSYFLSKPSSNPQIQSILDHLKKANSAVSSMSVCIGAIYVELEAESRHKSIDEISLKIVSGWFTSSARFADRADAAEKYYDEATSHLQALRDELPIPHPGILDRGRIRKRAGTLLVTLQRLYSNLKGTARLLDFHFVPDPGESAMLHLLWDASTTLKSSISDAFEDINPKVEIPAAIATLKSIPDLSNNPF